LFVRQKIVVDDVVKVVQERLIEDNRGRSGFHFEQAVVEMGVHYV
jgi:hypothetical protein